MKSNPAPAFFAFLFLLSATDSSLQIFPPAQAGERVVLTSPAGKSIRAEVIAFEAGAESIKYRRVRDGKVFQSKVSIFDPATRDRLKTLQPAVAPLRIDVHTAEKVLYDREREMWKGPERSGFDTYSSDVVRVVVELENRTPSDVENLEIDLVIVVGARRGSGNTRQIRQTFPVRKLKGAGTIEVLSEPFSVRSLRDDDRPEEAIKGIALQLREADSETVVFQWNDDKLAGLRIEWGTSRAIAQK
ncbi:MAG: hypothetical protein HKN23_02600 [Verrucomicrobiales bacterium]|nr:hypothetical protein [Verrucomicrobiales bacterium]